MAESKTSVKLGLTTREAESSKKRYGDNSLTVKKKLGFFSMLASNFSDPIIRILIAALCANVIFTFRNFDWSETIGIVVAIILATVVSTLSERGSELAFEKLKEESSKSKCRVIRDGEPTELSVEDVVIGDVVMIEAGERIPADGLLISGAVDVDQSAFNGESKEAHKHPDREAPCRDLQSPNMMFRGTVVTSGEGLMRVTSVGNTTFWGELALEIQEDTRQSPLKLRLAHLASTISKIGYAAAVLVALMSLFDAFVLDSLSEVGGPVFGNYLLWQSVLAKFNFHFILSELIRALTLAITVIVVAVPEGLPMMITVVLSSNMKKMMKDNVLVRKLVGIETAGSLNILFTDKTGTLTEGVLSVNGFVLGNGETVDSVGRLKAYPEIFEKYLKSTVFNTSSSLSGKRVIGGNATDRALLQSVCDYARRPAFSAMRTVSKIPFDSEKKFSAAKMENGLSFVKGAPEKILPGCERCLSAEGAEIQISSRKVYSKWQEMTSKGIRVIAIACRRGNVSSESDLRGLTLICLVGIRDRVRKESRAAVRELKDAGIQVVMLTGDNIKTAEAVAAECGLITSYGREIVLDAAELHTMGDRKLKELLPRIAVISRALPADKSRLIRIAQEMELVVGMTGDGINDAPALKKADVGFSMGSGTEIAKEASDIVITDNNIKSIAKSVLYGRTIFKSIRKFIVFQLTMNLCAVGVSLVGPIIGIDTPVTVIQMLWVNIIMDTLGGLAFAGEPPLESYMKEPPKRRDEPILNSYMLNQIIVTGLFTVAVSVLFLSLDFTRNYFGFSEDRLPFLTAFFAMFIFQSVLNCFNARTSRLSIFRGVSKNKPFVIIIFFVLLTQTLMIYFGGTVFRTIPLPPRMLLSAIAISLAVIPADIIRKLILRLTGKKHDL